MVGITADHFKVKLAVMHIARGFWAVILSQAAWKRSWAAHDPAQSKMSTDRMVATTGIAAWAQLLTE